MRLDYKRMGQGVWLNLLARVVVYMVQWGYRRLLGAFIPIPLHIFQFAEKIGRSHAS